MYTKIPQPEKGTSYLRYHPKASKLCWKDAIPFLCSLTYSSLPSATRTSTQPPPAPMKPACLNGRRAVVVRRKRVRKKDCVNLCVCVRGTSSLQLTSQRPWATRHAVCLNTFVCQLSLPVFRTSESMLNWLHGSCMIYRSSATWCCASSSTQSTLALLHLYILHNPGGAMPHAASNSDAQGRCSMLASLGVVVQTPKVQFQPRKKMFQYIGPG